ncbi:MAG TPA: ferrochelatase [Polyangia bacterium]|nr:ferrochelatase [Polyangia bacterium]
MAAPADAAEAGHATSARATSGPLGLIALNLGGPNSLDDVRPFLERLFGDPDVIQLGWMSPLQKLVAWSIARSRAPYSREAYAQIGGRSPILAETTAQIQAVAALLGARGVTTVPVVAMAAWHPLADEALAALAARGVRRAIALPLYPQESRTTTDSSLNQIEAARARHPGLEIAAVRRYPDADGYLRAVVERIEDAIHALPPEHAATAPVLFSAHGLPEDYIRKGDPYLDDIRVTVEAVSRRMRLGERARLCFQSRVGPKRWLGPTTEEVIDGLAAAGTPAVVVVPIAFTGEHIETLQEIDILYRERAEKAGIAHFARARTVGTHPAFIATLADLAEQAARARGWL